MTTYLITESDDTLDTPKVSDLLSKIDPACDSVVTDCGTVVHQPNEPDATASAQVETV